MIHLSYQEAYVLGLVSQLKDETKTSIAFSLLLGLYTSHFLDALEVRGMGAQDEGYIDEYLRRSGEEMFNKNIFYPVLKKLIDLNLVEVERESIFKHFSRLRLLGQVSENDVFLQNKLIKNPCKVDLNEFILHILQKRKFLQKGQKLKKIIEVFNARLLSFLHFFENEGEKFEFRLFWPESIAPKVYAMEGWFEEVKYKKTREADEYIIKNENAVIKLRGDQLHTKSCTHDFYGIGRFTKKKKEDIPLDKRTLLQQKTVEVTKKKHLHKRKGHVKIEFATLTVQDEKWRTICIESPSLPTVLTLSLLINPNHSEKLNYTAFINKFYSPI